MSQILLQQPYKHILLQWSLLLTCLTGLSGCVPTALSASTEITTAESCLLETPEVNIYLANPSIITLNTINLLATPTPDLITLAPPDPTLASSNLAKARYAALDRLTHEVERWTDIQSIRVDEASEIKIMVTFLHPDLIQAVALNNILLNNPNVLNNTATAQQIDAEVRNALNQFAMRKKLIFLITIPVIPKTETSFPHTISMKIHEMILKNSNNMGIRPDYDDHNLNQTINPNDKAIFGYFYYPLAVLHNNTCTEVLSSEYNTKIVIETSSLIIDDTAGEAKVWTIPYDPLLDIGPSYYMPDLPPANQLSLTPISPVNDPPQTNLSIEALQNNKEFWQEFGRFVWAQLTFEVYNK